MERLSGIWLEIFVPPRNNVSDVAKSQAGYRRVMYDYAWRYYQRDLDDKCVS